jgi:hypothetical protein
MHAHGTSPEGSCDDCTLLQAGGSSPCLREYACCFHPLVLLLSGIAGAQAQNWTRHTYAKDGFEAEFSDAVKISPTDVDAQMRARILRVTSPLRR